MVDKVFGEAERVLEETYSLEPLPQFMPQKYQEHQIKIDLDLTNRDCNYMMVNVWTMDVVNDMLSAIEELGYKPGDTFMVSKHLDYSLTYEYYPKAIFTMTIFTPIWNAA